MLGTMCACCKNSLKANEKSFKTYHTFLKETDPKRFKSYILITKRTEKCNSYLF